MSLSLLNSVAQLAVAQSVCHPDDSTPFSLRFHILLLKRMQLFYLVRVGLSRSGEKYKRWLAKRAKRVWSGAWRSLTSTSYSWVSPAKWKICSRTTTWTKSETPATERLPSTSGFILFSFQHLLVRGHRGFIEIVLLLLLLLISDNLLAVDVLM